MNLSQVERRLQAVDFMANYVNYKYNPHIEKIDDLKQHIHKDLLIEDAQRDQAIYGLAAFQEGDPAEIVRGSQEMSVSGGPRRGKSGTGTASRMTAGGESYGGNITRPTTAERSHGNLSGHLKQKQLEHTQSHDMINRDLYRFGAATKQQRPFTSKTSNNMYRSSSLYNRSIGGGGNKSTTWNLSRPLRSNTGKNQHLISKSKIKVADLPASGTVSTGIALGRYHGDQMKKLLHKPRMVHDPTVFYKVGDHLKTKQETIFEKSPHRPISLLDQEGSTRCFNAIMLEHATQRKQEQYGNLMKQLYKIKIPDQILEIIHDSNFEIKYRSYQEEPTREQLMQIINTQYIQGLISSDGQSKRTLAASQTIASQQASLHVDQKSKQGTQHALSSSRQVLRGVTPTIGHSSKALLNKGGSMGDITSRPITKECSIENNSIRCIPTNSNAGSKTKIIDLAEEAQRNEFTKKLTQALHKTDSVPELIDQTSMEYESEKFIKPADASQTMKLKPQDVETQRLSRESNQMQKQSRSNLDLNKILAERKKQKQTGLSVDKSRTELQLEGDIRVADDPFVVRKTATVGGTHDQYHKKSHSRQAASVAGPLKSVTQKQQTSRASDSTVLNPLLIQEDKDHAQEMPIKNYPGYEKQSTLFMMSDHAVSAHKTPYDQSTQKMSPVIDYHMHTRPIGKNLDGKLLFNLKITDLTRSDNPFVFYENQQVDKDGYLLFQCPDQQKDLEKEQGSVTGSMQNKRKILPKASLFKSYNNLQPLNAKNSMTALESQQTDTIGEELIDSMPLLPTKNSLDATIMLPWLQKPTDLEKRTLKIEVTFKGELILLRIIHIDKLYPVQYPTMALQIANNMIQSNLLHEKNILVDDAPPTPTPLNHQQKIANKTYIHLDGTRPQKGLTKASSMQTYDLSHTTHPIQLKASGILQDPNLSLSLKEIDDQVGTSQESKLDGQLTKKHKQLSPASKISPYRQAAIQGNMQQQFTNARKSGPVPLAQFPDSATHINSKRSSLLPNDTGSQKGKTDFKVANSVKEQQEDPMEFACEAGGGRASGENSHGYEGLDGSQKFHLERTYINLEEQPLSGNNVSLKDLHDLRASKQDYGSQLGISRIREKTGPHKSVHFRIRPQKNDILDILQSLERHELNVMEVPNEIKAMRMRQFPEVMKNLQVIIEFSDCIIQAKDLLNFEIVIDEDEQRIHEKNLEAQEKRQGLPNNGKIEGRQCSPAKDPKPKYGIIRENDKQQNGGLMSAARTQLVKKFVKSNAANYYVRHNTEKRLNLIKQAQRDCLPTCAMNMKSKTDQFKFLQGSSALTTNAVQPQFRSHDLTAVHKAKAYGAIRTPRLVGTTRSNFYDEPIQSQERNRLQQMQLVQAVVKAQEGHRFDRVHATINRVASQSQQSPLENPVNTRLQHSKFQNQTLSNVADALSSKHTPGSGTLSNVGNKKGTLTRGGADESHQEPGFNTIAGNATHSVPTVTHSQYMVNSGDVEDFRLGQTGIIYQDQVVVMQNKSYRQGSGHRRQPGNGKTALAQERIVRPNIKGLLRTQHHNSDLDDLQRSAQKPEMMNLAQVMMSADANQLDRRIDLQELQMQSNNMYGQGEKTVMAIPGMMRYSEEYVRNSLLKQSKLTVNTPANMLSADVGNNQVYMQAHGPDQVQTPVESLNSPIGPIAYTSKYQKNHVSTNLQSSSSVIKTTQPQLTNTSQMMKRGNGKAESLACTNYGLSANMPVAPIVHQHETKDKALSASMCSKDLVERIETEATKARQESVLQHQSYCESRSALDKRSPTPTYAQQSSKKVQLLAPVSNYLYRGSAARRTVRDLLDAKQEFDASLLYEAITNKKFDVPVTRQDFSQLGRHQ